MLLVQLLRTAADIFSLSFPTRRGFHGVASNAFVTFLKAWSIAITAHKGQRMQKYKHQDPQYCRNTRVELGRALHKLGRRQEAWVELEAAVKLDVEDINAHLQKVRKPTLKLGKVSSSSHLSQTRK